MKIYINVLDKKTLEVESTTMDYHCVLMLCNWISKLHLHKDYSLWSMLKKWSQSKNVVIANATEELVYNDRFLLLQGLTARWL